MKHDTHDDTRRQHHEDDAGHHGGHGDRDGDHRSDPKHQVDHAGHEEMFRRRFWVALILSIPVILYDPMIQQWVGFTMPAFPGSQWVNPVFAIAVFFLRGHVKRCAKRVQAAPSQGRSLTRTPLTYCAPSCTSFINSGAFSRRNRCWATSSIFQMTAVALLTFLKRFAASVRSLRAAKGDSIGLLVRRCGQCAFGNR